MEIFNYSDVSKMKIKVIKTGSLMLDKMLNGGYKTFTINEIYGEAGTGKTILMHQLLVNAYLTFKDGLYFIDAENTFRPELLLKIGKRYSLSNEILRYILVSNPLDLESFLITLNTMKEKGNVNFLGLDTLTTYLRHLEVKKYNKILRQIASTLLYLSNKGTCVIFTNQVKSKPNDTDQNRDFYPLGGKIIEELVTTRIKLIKEANKIICELEISKEGINKRKETFRILNYGFLGFSEKIKLTNV